MAIINNSSELTINTYASKEIFDTLKAQGKVKDNELHLIEGEDTDIEALSNIEIEEILSKFI